MPPNWESRHLDGESKKVYELDKGHTSNAKNAAWVRWCRARKLNYGATVPDEMKIKSAAFENLVYDPVKERHKIDYWLRKVFFVSARDYKSLICRDS